MGGWWYRMWSMRMMLLSAYECVEVVQFCESFCLSLYTQQILIGSFYVIQLSAGETVSDSTTCVIRGMECLNLTRNLHRGGSASRRVLRTDPFLVHRL